MRLYFLRHAEAEPDFLDDYNRRLTPKGVEQTEKVTQFCQRNGLFPDLVLTSPVVRARQTADKVFGKMGGSEIVECAWLACGMTPATLMDELAGYAKFANVCLVGHEPDFSESIAFLSGSRLNVRKASLTLVDLPSVRSGAGELQFSIPARLM